MAHTAVLQKRGFCAFLESFLLYLWFGKIKKVSAENPRLRKAAKRYRALKT
jgi:hypothetical protein